VTPNEPTDSNSIPSIYIIALAVVIIVVVAAGLIVYKTHK
jgi:hypothetical protein